MSVFIAKEHPFGDIVESLWVSNWVFSTYSISRNEDYETRIKQYHKWSGKILEDKHVSRGHNTTLNLPSSKI